MTKKPLWRIVGTAKSGGAATIKVRADNYSEAVSIAKSRNLEIRDVVLIEGSP